MDGDGTPLLFLLIFLLMASAYFSATEIAFSSLNKVRMKNRADDGDRRAQRAMYIVAHFESALTTILIGNNISNIASAAIATLLATKWWGAGSVMAATVMITVFVFLFSEMLPKRFGRDNSEQFALCVSGSLIFLIKIFRPVAWAFLKLNRLIANWCPPPDGPSYTEDELKDIIETIEDEGVLEPEQQELVQSAYEFGGITALDILIPMDRVVAVSVLDSKARLMEIVQQSKYSRFPVMGRNGRVIGVLQASRFLTACLRGKYDGVRPLMRPVSSYRADMHIDDLMHEMNRRRQHMALITENMSVLGIVTMEDILEELVGEIWDEDDIAPEEAEGGAH